MDLAKEQRDVEERIARKDLEEAVEGTEAVTAEPQTPDNAGQPEAGEMGEDSHNSNEEEGDDRMEGCSNIASCVVGQRGHCQREGGGWIR